MGTNESSWITVKQLLAGELKGKATRNTVYRAIGQGIIPHIRISERRILIPGDALERMLKNGQ